MLRVWPVALGGSRDTLIVYESRWAPLMPLMPLIQLKLVIPYHFAEQIGLHLHECGELF